MDNTFLSYASDILGDTNDGLSGSEIVKYFVDFAVDFNASLKYGSYPFKGKTIPNKRGAFKENLGCFNEEQQFAIIKFICELPKFEKNDKVKELKIRLFTRYGHLAKTKITDTELVIKTKHWLEDHIPALNKYNEALQKYEVGIYKRNILDDMRLSFELLVKDILNNNKSLENQISEIGTILKGKGVPNEFRSMITSLINYYTKYQNDYVKHDDKVQESQISYIIEYTSIIMKYLISIIK